MKNFTKLMLAWALLGAGSGTGMAQDIPVVDSWDVELTAPADHPVSVIRGETKYLRPRYLVNGAAATITNITSVQLWYKPSGLATASWFYVTNGTFLGSGVVQVPWSPACESTWSEYNYNVVAATALGNSLSAAGKLTLRGNVTGSQTTAPPGRVVYVSDSATYVTNGGASFNGVPISNGVNIVVDTNSSSTAWTNVYGVPSVWNGTATDDVARAAIIVETNRAQQAEALLLPIASTNGWETGPHTNLAPRSWVAGFSSAPATWNEDERTIDVSFPDGTTGQLFEEIWITVRNTSGTTITNGKVVRACSANGYYSGAELASSTGTFDQATDVMGMATETITNNGIGKITIIGNVNQLDTTALEEGSNLWLSATAGEVTMIRPTTSANKQVLIGRCLRSNVNQGRIEVAIQVIPWPVDIGAVASGETNGWVVSSHSNFVTNGQKIAASTNADYATTSGTASNLAGVQSNRLEAAITNAVVKLITTYSITNPVITLSESVNVWNWTPPTNVPLSCEFSGPGAGWAGSGMLRLVRTNGDNSVSWPTNATFFSNGTRTTNPPTLDRYNRLVVDYFDGMWTLGLVSTNLVSL